MGTLTKRGEASARTVLAEKSSRPMPLRSFLRSERFLARVTRFTILLGTVAAVDTILGSLRVDLIGALHLSLGLFWSLILNLYLVLELTFFPATVEVPTSSPTDAQQPRAFVSALIDFIETLQRQGKTSTILEIRDSMSHLLHLLGEHEARYKLGEIALAAAIDGKDDLHRAQILVDDLGWAAFQINRRNAAENIRRGIAIAEHIPMSGGSAGPARLVAAKGYRHLAMMSADYSSIQAALDAARTTLKSLDAVPIVASTLQPEISRDFAQIDHAESTLIIRALGIERNGELPASGTKAVQRAQEALQLVTKAENAFASIGDYERVTKALITKERILAALGDETAALETRAQRESVARSHSVRKQ